MSKFESAKGEHMKTKKTDKFIEDENTERQKLITKLQKEAGNINPSRGCSILDLLDEDFLCYLKRNGKIRGAIRENYGAQHDIKSYFSVGPKLFNICSNNYVREEFRVESFEKLKEIAKSQGYDIIEAGESMVCGFSQSHYDFKKV